MMVHLLWSSRRRRVSLALASLATAAAALLAAAWVASPAATLLQARVQARLRGTDARALPLSAIPLDLRDAVVATEDERFYHHHGIDVVGLIRALPYDVVHLSFAQGASTITEQVGKILYLGGNDHSPWRKLEDMTLALKLERRYSKEEILAAYLDSAYFGSGAYGVWSASKRYFALRPSRLDLAQAALLAGLIQAPSAYDPLEHPAAARARQVEVLRSLVRSGFVTAAGAAAALRRPLELRGGLPLAPLRGVNLAPGPAFLWWQLALGSAIVAAGGAALIASRLSRFRAIRGLLVLRALLFALLILGVAVVVRSFRTA